MLCEMAGPETISTQRYIKERLHVLGILPLSGGIVCNHGCYDVCAGLRLSLSTLVLQGSDSVRSAGTSGIRVWHPWLDLWIA